ncbi:SprT-like domain-containing protein [Sphingomonas sp. Ag1]|uniref:SprT-like domain-containing protein n=1 Tax=Sphingomonas sp. Ag1 TaxID=1642949 RepID=UPI000621FBB7|nr:SprT-like domain-containing protein [Sphingomonas sp. Ag1]KKI21914.1 transcription elongation protein SprT [Sphingomonas sp. Ag1]
MEQDNRESWLNRVAVGMTPLFETLGAPLPSRVRVAIGFTSRGAKGKAIGECWDNRCSGDGHFEIFIRPDLAHAADAMPAQIAAILAHELVHAAVGIAAGHGKAFKRVAIGLGLVGPMRATTPGDVFLATIAPILAAAGSLPHARLDTGGETTQPKKQAARLLKCECEACGYTVRTARKWLELVGAPLCPVEDHGPMRHDPFNGDEDSEPNDNS